MSLAREAYADFLDEVVIRHAFSATERDRAGNLLPAAALAQVGDGKRIDTRAPFLAACSGKGGWHPDPEKARAYARWTNVSLLDHLCSVVRGALQVAALDLAAHGLTEDAIRPRLPLIAAVAFLHDADKMLGKERAHALTAEDIELLMERYGVVEFLRAHGGEVGPEEMLSLIDEAEVSRAGRLRRGVPLPPREALHDCAYVRFADRVDGIFLDATKGPAGVVEEARAYAGLRTSALRDCRVLEIRDPHAPFLLDELQDSLSSSCFDRHGFPPLIELHHDGRLVVIVPQQGWEELVAAALATVTRPLGASIRIGTTTRGKVDLLDAPGTVADLRAAIAAMDSRSRESVLRVGVDLLRERASDLDGLFRAAGFLPRPPDLDRFLGRLVPLWSGKLDDREEAIHADAVLLNALLSCVDPPPSLGIPAAAIREGELVEQLCAEGAPILPDWLVAAPDDSRRIVLAALAAARADTEEVLRERLFGHEGLAALWLEGRDPRKGLAAKIDPSGARLSLAVKAHFGALLSGDLVRAADEEAPGRCHFTNAPVGRETRIDGKTGLYAVKVSAFSGREGRPESARSMQSETLISPISEAEHRLRQIRFGRSSGERKLPVRVTSPVSAGLFGALAYNAADEPGNFAFSDVLRAKMDGGRLTLSGDEGLSRRVRIARYEEMPTRLVSVGNEPGQIAFVAMAMACALRLGRPVHVFRGLPRPRPEFVAFDFLPAAIELLLGGTAFRLEEVPGRLALLRGVEAVAETTGFGPELALRLGDPITRFSGACEALARAERRLDADEGGPGLANIRRFTLNLVEESRSMMTEYDKALVEFGEAMALAQRAPLQSDGGNVAEIGLRTALDVVEDLERLGQVSDESLRAGVAGSLEDTLARRDLFARGEVRDGRPASDAIAAAAEIFVERIWAGAFRRTLPPSRARRVCLATYRWAFQAAARSKRAAKPHDNAS